MIWNAYSEEKQKSLGLTIRSCGHIFAKPGREVYRPLGRQDWLLFYVSKEHEVFYFDNPAIANEGSFVIFRPGEKQHHRYDGDKTAEFYYVHFTLDEGFTFEFESSRIYEAEPSAKVCEIFESIISELQLKQPYYEELCTGKLVELFSLLLRKTESYDSNTSDDFGKIAFVVQHIHKNYNVSESLEVYAEMCSLSKFHFLRKFEEITGMTPISYKNKLRIAHAKEMLEDSAFSINEIGEAVGYSSASYFCDAFKKETGVSPREYRRTKNTVK